MIYVVKNRSRKQSILPNNSEIWRGARDMKIEIVRAKCVLSNGVIKKGGRLNRFRENLTYMGKLCTFIPLDPT